MRTASLILRNQGNYAFYSSEAFLGYLDILDPSRIFIAFSDPVSENSSTGVIESLRHSKELSHKLVDVSVSADVLREENSAFSAEVASDSTLLAKKKMMDMFTDTIYSYLGGTWKDFQTLNSHDTNSIFKARYLLISSVLPEYLSKHMYPHLKSIGEKISQHEPVEEDVVISDIEWSFWFNDNVKLSKI